MADMIKFFRGQVANLPATGLDGALYITNDEGGIYLGTGTGMKRLGDFVQVANVDALPAKAHENCLYYCVAENILAKWNGEEWKQVNKQPTTEELKTLLGLGSLAYKSDVAEADLASALATKINNAANAQHTHDFADSDVKDAIAKKHSHSFADEAALNGITSAKVTAWDSAEQNAKTYAKDYADGLNTAMNTRVEALEAIDHEHANKTELDKIAAGDVKKWNDVVADYLTSTDKTALVDSIGDVNTALENYKTSNNEALAGVKATAEAAATKEYTDAELAKKVAKADYEADKATFATKSELNDVDAKFASYNTTAAQKAIDDAQDAEIAKKVDKVEGKDLIATSEIERLATLKNYDDTALAGRVTTAEGQIQLLNSASATHALKTEVEAVDAKFADYTKTADLPTDLGDFTNEAGYAKTADVNTELAKKADKTQVATDIAAAVAPLATTEALNAVKATAEAARTESEVDGQIDAKISALNLGTTYEPIGAETRAKSYVDQKFTDANLAQYTTEQEVKDIVDGVISAAADDETYNSLTKLIDYVDTHKGEAIDMAEDIADHETRIGALEGKPASGITATQIENWDNEVGAKELAASKTTTAEVKTQIEAYGYATTTQVATAKQEAIDAAASAAAAKYEEIGVAQTKVDALANGQVKTNTEAIATKANAADVYAKTETYTQEEVNAAIAAAVEAAHTWGTF